MPHPPKPVRPEKTRRNTLHCSFCGQSEDYVDDLIAGPTVFICGTCVELSFEIVQRARQQRAVRALALVTVEHAGSADERLNQNDGERG